jgi:NAD(P)-dependent dehydrogenase (short-subunit alcohol dehydrogenase family)
MFDFTGKIVIVTGGSGNLGSATVKAFAAAGASLVIPDRGNEGLDVLFPDLPGDDHVLVSGVDLTEPDGAARTIKAAVDRFGTIDVLVNTVGGFRGGKPTHETGVETWDFLLKLNARSVFVMCEAVIPVMLEHGGGAIISTAARNAIKARANISAQSASKAAIARLTESMAAEYKMQNITANAILPGTIDTPQNREAMPKADFSKWVAPEAIAQVILFLASDAGRVITGGLIPVYGKS